MLEDISEMQKKIYVKRIEKRFVRTFCDEKKHKVFVMYCKEHHLVGIATMDRVHMICPPSHFVDSEVIIAGFATLVLNLHREEKE
jgi:hypothetical protein